jgi:P22_AR N-terminal domain
MLVMEEKNMQIVTVDFYKQSLTIIEKEGEKYVAMRPIVEGIGLSWSSQCQKLVSNGHKFNCVVINTVASDGKQHKMLCIPIKKLNGYLFSINPEKVHEDIKDKVILYQEECFVALIHALKRRFNFLKNLF